MKIGDIVKVGGYNSYWDGTILQVYSSFIKDEKFEAALKDFELPAGGGISFGSGYDCKLLSPLDNHLKKAANNITRWHPKYLLPYETCGYCPGVDRLKHPDPEIMCDNCWNFMHNPPVCDCDVFNFGCSCRRLEWEQRHSTLATLLQ